MQFQVLNSELQMLLVYVGQKVDLICSKEKESACGFS